MKPEFRQLQARRSPALGSQLGAPTPPAWIDQESGFVEAWQEIKRLAHRAPRRPFLIVFLAAAAALGAVARQALDKGRFEASVTFRVFERVEGRQDETRPHTKRRLREYLKEGIFTREHCREVVRRFGLYPELVEIDENRAADALRDDIQVEVFQNYFLKEDLHVSAPRSARVRLVYGYRDPELARKAVRALANLVIDHENAVRRELAQAAARHAARAELSSEQKLEALRRELAIARLALLNAKGEHAAALQVKIAQLQQAITEVDERLVRLIAERETVDLRAGLEQHHLLLRFAIVDWGQSAAPRLSRNARLSLVGGIVFFVLLPVIGLAVAAFDTRIYSNQDVRRLGLTALGHVPPWPGDQRGALQDRTDIAPRRRGKA